MTEPPLRCTCPHGWAAKRDPRCPVHSAINRGLTTPNQLRAALLSAAEVKRFPLQGGALTHHYKPDGTRW